MTSRTGCALALLLAIASACSREEHKDTKPSPSERPELASSTPPEPPPQLLYLPDGGDIGPPRAPGQQVLPGPWGHVGSRCPPDMVSVHEFCIDRYEDSLIDTADGREISPYYHPTRSQTQASYGRARRGMGDGGTLQGHTMAVPEPPTFQLKEDFSPRAVSKGGVVPSGYLNLTVAELACKNAGKRLCTEAEWVTACKGEQGRRFPYGDEYEAGRCNVFREAHPAMVLYGNPSIGHLDPRLNKVRSHGRPLLRATGATPECKSIWGNDAIYDMVGNLDEWIDDPGGVFVGGFYSRNTKAGCEARISAHTPPYFDYSLGVRCCKTP
ncbi:MAG: SUMF1/EgtB/PvdO family nonheme iron enzyme [Myxococcales bacterium]|nr:SUMF1/EgtB/PvdO family nonheme iron enzyme [Myxococcales bacterium]MCB9580309.1 SUMF1/EgtB/PvdO family nonheme iron enzyme [Polyangiaceae bacterium]